MKDLVLKSQKESWLKRPEDIISDYYYVTLHRPYNTDEKIDLSYVLESMNGLRKHAVFAIHPRTKQAMMAKFGMKPSQFPNIKFIEPQGYLSNLNYLAFSGD